MEKQDRIMVIDKAGRTSALLAQLVNVWECSVRATHLFLSSSEVDAIKEYVPQALSGVTHLFVVVNVSEVPIAFMGVEGQRIEMLFIAPEERGKGWGKRLVRCGVDRLRVCEVTVNKQNPQAVGFYERMGFQVYKEAERDEQGAPYPLLYMRYDK